MARKPSPRRRLMESRSRATIGPLRMPDGKGKVVPAVQPNAGTKARYQARMESLIDEMQRSIMHWLPAAYRAAPPEMAADAVPARVLGRAIAKLARYWQRRFDEAAPRLAEYFATAVEERSNSSLRQILRDAGFAVKFDATPTTTDIFAATLTENIGLIKSIASEHFIDVRGIIMRSVQTGRDLAQATEDLVAAFGVTRRRAETIARDQNNKATSAITIARKVELGLFEADWKHSHAGNQPRPSHVAADGKRYDIRQGCYIDGEYIQPGEKINCRCTAKTVIPGF